MRNNYNRKTPFRGEELRRPEMTGNFGKAFVKLQEAAENGGMLLKINFQAAIIIVILPLFHRKNKDFFNFAGLT